MRRFRLCPAVLALVLLMTIALATPTGDAAASATDASPVAAAAVAQTFPMSPELQNFADYMWQVVFSKVMTVDEFNAGQYPTNEWARAYGVVFRRQWDYAEELPEGPDKAYQKRYLEVLWQELTAFMNHVGAQTNWGGELFSEMNQGFWERGFGGDGSSQYEQLLRGLGFDRVTLPPIFGWTGGTPPTPVPPQTWTCSVDASGAGGDDPFCSSFVENVDDLTMIFHIVNQGPLRAGAQMPSNWLNHRFNTCEILINDHTQDCRRWMQRGNQ